MRHYRRNPRTKTTNVQERRELAIREIELAEHYLATGEGANEQCFRPILNYDGKGDTAPPHPDWVRNVFIPIRKKVVARCDKVLNVIEEKESDREKNRHRERSPGLRTEDCDHPPVD